MDGTHVNGTAGEDDGFTLVEILVVLVVLGVLASVAVFAVRGATGKGEEASCQAEYSTMVGAAEFYLANHNVDEIPATGLGDDRFERTLVGDALLREVSTFHDVAADGSVTATGVPCD